MNFPILQRKNQNHPIAGGLTTNRAMNLAMSAVFGALYAVLTILFAPISLLSLQIRVSEVLIAFIPIFGWPVLVGLTIGTFLGNIVSPLGVIDMVVGTFATFVGGLGVLYIKQETVGFSFYAAIVSLIVGWELALVYTLPLALTIGQVFVGELIAAGFGGSMIFSAARRIFPNQSPNT